MFRDQPHYCPFSARQLIKSWWTMLTCSMHKCFVGVQRDASSAVHTVYLILLALLATA